MDDYRIVFRDGKQREFINEVKKESKMTWKEISHITGLCEITLRHSLRKSVHLMSYDVFKKLCECGDIDVDKYSRHILEIRDKNWGQAKGGRIGGLKRGVGKPKIHIKKPRISVKLAELIGILLGDGSLSERNYSIEITLNRNEEFLYSNYVSNLIYELFGILPKKIFPSDKNVLKLRINSKSLFEFLVGMGLVYGRNEKSIPSFIYNDRKLMTANLRGLFDTDGSLHLSSRWCVLNFKSYSSTLKKQIESGLNSIGIPISISRNNINMTSLWKINKFMECVGSSHLKNIIKFIEYTENKKTVRSNDIENLLSKYGSIQLPYHGVMV